MALSKLFLSNSGGAAGNVGPAGARAFEKDMLIPEISIGHPADMQAVLGWYPLVRFHSFFYLKHSWQAHEHSNPNATVRLSDLSVPSCQFLSCQEHNTIKTYLP